jgi:hypothetical protein
VTEVELQEWQITDNEKHRIFMRAVRTPDGRLLGYYERYEPPRPGGGTTVLKP